MINILLLTQISNPGEQAREAIWHAQMRLDVAGLERALPARRVEFKHGDAFKGLISFASGEKRMGLSDVSKLKLIVRKMVGQGYATHGPSGIGIANNWPQMPSAFARVWFEETRDGDILIAHTYKPLVRLLEREDLLLDQATWARRPKDQAPQDFYLPAASTFAQFINPNTSATRQGAPPLNAAAFYGRTAIMDILRKRGAKLEGKNRRGETARHAACMKNREVNAAAVRLLLRWGANRDAKNVDGETPMDMAKRKKFDLILAAFE